MDRWVDEDEKENLPDGAANEPVADSLGDVESQLGQLLDELRGLQLERHIAKPVADGAEALDLPVSKIEWDSSLEDFLLKATVIRRMLSQFRGSDLSTRRYLRHQLDEEFENLKSVYGSLSEQFTTN